MLIKGLLYSADKPVNGEIIFTEERYSFVMQRLAKSEQNYERLWRPESLWILPLPTTNPCAKIINTTKALPT